MKLLKKLLPLLLIISIIFFAISCDKVPDNNDDPTVENGGNDDGKPSGGDDNSDGGNDSDTEPETATYTVTVTNPFGKPVSDVTVYIHKDGGEDYNVCTTPAVTDDEGKVSFTLDTAFTYSVQVASIPLVYSALSGYVFKS